MQIYISYINNYIHTFIHTYIHTYIHNANIHSYINNYIHSYIYTYIHVLGSRVPNASFNKRPLGKLPRHVLTLQKIVLFI